MKNVQTINVKMQEKKNYHMCSRK